MRERLFELWQELEAARADYQAAAWRNINGLSARERFEADLHYRRAKSRLLDANAAYERARAAGKPHDHQ